MKSQTYQSFERIIESLRSDGASARKDMRMRVSSTFRLSSRLVLNFSTDS